MVVNSVMSLLKFQTAVNYAYVTECPAERVFVGLTHVLGKNK